MSVIVGSNLTAIRGRYVKSLSSSLNKLTKNLNKMGASTGIPGKLPAHKAFVKAGDPVENTSADSPGSDICFIINKTDNSLWMVYEWVTSTDFAVVELIA